MISDLVDVDPVCRRVINKSCKKNPVLLKSLRNKIREIIENPERYKPMKYDLAGKRRVHILKSFVLTYKIKEGVVHIVDFEHHDDAYRR